MGLGVQTTMFFHWWGNQVCGSKTKERWDWILFSVCTKVPNKPYLQQPWTLDWWEL